LVASLCVRTLFGNVGRLGATIPHGTPLQSLGLETILTFILFLVILRVSTGAREKGITAGIAIGAVIALEALLGGPVSGASMNPARSYGPAIVGMDFRALSSLWIYCVGPIVGVALAVPVSRFLGPDNASAHSP
jgi:aquaporin Z